MEGLLFSVYIVRYLINLNVKYEVMKLLERQCNERFLTEIKNFKYIKNWYIRPYYKYKPLFIKWYY